MEKAIKQRLLGGVVLVAGAALFLPMFLNGSGAMLTTVPPMPLSPAAPTVEAIAPPLDKQVQQADQAVDVAHAVPKTLDVNAVSVATNATDTGIVNTETGTGAGTKTKVAAATAVALPPVAPKPEAIPDEAAQKAAQEKAAREKAAREKAKAKADAEKARQAAAEAAKKEKEAAAAKAAAAKKEAAAKTTKTNATPAATTATTSASALPEAWVVQIASFSSKDKADALVQKLRQKNYRATVKQRGDAWKVVVGPELSKEVAESIKSRLAADSDIKLSGWIQAYKP